MAPVPKHHDLIVVGAGFGGLGMGIRLKQAGRDDFVIVDQGSGVGGTWHANRYPGAACDIPSLLYSYSFAPNPNWSRNYPEQAEIEAYLNDCVERFGLAPHLQLRTRVTAIAWDAHTQRWAVDAQQRDGAALRWTARVVVAATGALSRPATPDVPGLAEFAGPVMHTARWRAELPLEGRRIGVVGTGASAVQLVPRLAEKASRVVLFQRTPAWVLPKRDRPIGAFRRWVHEHVPGARRLARALIYAVHEMRAPGFTWRPALLKSLEPVASLQLRKQVKDPALREALTPRYRLGCKRILIASDFYPALQRPHVELVPTAIARVVPDGVIGADGRHHPLDVLVLATGFHAAEAMAPFPVHGRNGADLNQVWRDGARAYLGTTVPGFPNLFFLVGPNTGLGHNSMVYMIESQLRYVVDALERMDRAGIAALDTKPQVADAFNDELQRRMKGTVWSTGGCTSWYQTRSGLITTLWPGSTLEFRLRTRRFRLADYDEPLRA
ncbi:flavin-containing monooxygenase [Piscinibacter sp.]|uniref:flavin-containing monooxygenase n=1 Tax=Piscinibacter sp. TaxID=1903157 RepID=UPI002BC049D7|nr:NAD(P)/FAD-dependent oxidoreductase [Albitalea sp.]HUG24302.1 NAD(P)/FAD-dependent oxidoreductase [Albitalea sp.]